MRITALNVTALTPTALTPRSLVPSGTRIKHHLLMLLQYLLNLFFGNRYPARRRRRHIHLPQILGFGNVAK